MLKFVNVLLTSLLFLLECLLKIILKNKTMHYYASSYLKRDIYYADFIYSDYSCDMSKKSIWSDLIQARSKILASWCIPVLSSDINNLTFPKQGSATNFSWMIIQTWLSLPEWTGNREVYLCKHANHHCSQIIRKFALWTQ